MNNYVQNILLVFILLSICILIYLVTIKKNNMHHISAYYNSQGAFAGFIQKNNNLIRACEFSSNGSILSCSKWFDSNILKQGQNQGVLKGDI